MEEDRPPPYSSKTIHKKWHHYIPTNVVMLNSKQLDIFDLEAPKETRLFIYVVYEDAVGR